MSVARTDDEKIDVGSLPGPLLARWSDLPHALDNLLGRAHERIFAYHQKYGI
jgi:hypothetical protein